ncbi:MAG: LLM class flavin-dependent oxidoreductase [Candidatus Microbacterium stercoravium]
MAPRNPPAHPFTVGIALDGAGWHPSAWRDLGADAASVFRPEYWSDLAVALDASGADYLTIDDTLALQGAGPADPSDVPPRPRDGIVSGRLDAALLASWIAPRTERIGISPTITTTQTEPFHVATGLQTLDHVSLGRAGWQVRLSADAAEAAAFGRRPAPEVRYDLLLAGEPDPELLALTDEAADVVDAARRLWDSWEDDAIIRDAATGRYLDRDRLHYVEVENERFSVIGPSIVPRSPQGQLPVTVLAHAAPIYRLAARAADVVFITPHRRGPGGEPGRYGGPVEILAEVREQEAAVDRAAEGLSPLRIVADLVVLLDVPGEPASERLARLDAYGIPLDSDAQVVAGSASEVADLIEGWQAAGIDGIRLRPASIAADVPAITDELLPELRARGLARENAPATLRERFSLPVAENRYATTSTTHTVTEAAA